MHNLESIFHNFPGGGGMPLNLQCILPPDPLVAYDVLNLNGKKNNTTATLGHWGHVEFPNTMLIEFQCLFRKDMVPTLFCMNAFWRSLWRIICKFLSESLRACACLNIARSYIAVTCSAVLAVRGQQVAFPFNADPVAKQNGNIWKQGDRWCAGNHRGLMFNVKKT